MNIVDRVFMSSILCAIWYHIEKCSVIEYVVSSIILACCWALLGAFEDRDKENGKWLNLSEFITSQIAKKTEDLLKFIDEVVTNDKERYAHVCTTICSIMDSTIPSESWQEVLDSIHDTLVKVELMGTIKKGSKKYLKKRKR